MELKGKDVSLSFFFIILIRMHPDKQTCGLLLVLPMHSLKRTSLPLALISCLKVTCLKCKPEHYLITTRKVAKESSVDNSLHRVKFPAVCLKNLSSCFRQ